MIKRFLFAVSLASIVGFTTSCSKSDEHDQNFSLQVTEGSTLRFSFSEEPFGEDKQVTRAQASSATPVQSVSLGNGIEADVFVDKEAAAPQTRGTLQPLRDGNYTILAFDSEGKRIRKIFGSITSGVFQANAASKERFSFLTPNKSYTFVCFNDKVHDDGTELTVAPADAETALIGIAPVNLGNSDQSVSFAMKHACARLRLRLLTYLPIDNNTKAQLSNAEAATSLSAFTPKAAVAFTYSEHQYTPSTTQKTDFSYVTPETDYYYCTPRAGKRLKLTFKGGEIYNQKALNNQSLRLSGIDSLECNGSYNVTIRLRYSIKYLFHDKTAGYLKDNHGKTPIGIVVKDKTASKDGLAIALDNAGEWTCWYGGTNQMYTSTAHPNFADAYNTYDGEDETWLPNANLNIVKPIAMKGNGEAFGHLGEYQDKLVEKLQSQHVSLTNGMENQKWFIAAMGEWKEAMKTLALFDETSLTTFNSSSPPPAGSESTSFNKDILNVVFWQVGVNSIFDGAYWTVTEIDAFDSIFISIGSTGLSFGHMLKYMDSHNVRPFVHF